MAIQLYNGRFILLTSFSFITIFSSIAIYFCLPILISHVIRSQLTLSHNSGSFSEWRLNSVIDRFYLYNITNIDLDTISDPTSVKQSPRAKLKLHEIGPFTFRQDREKINIRFNATSETVLYDQIKRWTFLPELSLAKSVEDLDKMWIYHMNVPLAGTTLNPEYIELVQPMGYPDVLMESAKGSGQIDVDKFGWLYNQNNSITRNISVFTGASNATLNKFGLVDQIGSSNRFRVWHRNGSEPNDTSNVTCNEFRSASAGEFFPPPEHSIISHNQHSKQQDLISSKTATSGLGSNMTSMSASAQILLQDIVSMGADGSSEHNSGSKLGRSISIVLPDLCRTFRLFYNRTYDYKDLSVDRYIANEMTYNYDNQDDDNNQSSRRSSQSSTQPENSNICYCTYNEASKLTSCPPNGMMDLFTCRKGSPTTISFPHFLYSQQDKSLAPYLAQFEDNVPANEEEHQFYMDLESTLNIPVRAQIVIQFNVHLRNEPALNFTRDYSFLFDTNNNNSNNQQKPALQDFYLPQMWFKSSAEIDDRNLNNLRFIQKHIRLVTPVATLIMFVLASILLLTSAKLAYDLTYGPKSAMSCDQESCASLSRHERSYLSDKQKYYAMQLLGDEPSNNLKANFSRHQEAESLNKPTTSKMNEFSAESDPLNS